MGGSSPSNTTQTTKTELSPEMNWHTNRALDNVRMASEQPFVPYSGQTVAPLNEQQMQALGIAQSQIGNYWPALNNASGALGAAGSALNQVRGATAPQAAGALATAGNVAGADLNPYLNPYTANVIDTSLGALDRTRQQQLAGNAAQATAAGAFGGSRSGVVDALTNEAALRESGSLAANLNSANFNQAQAALIGDLNRQTQNSQFNAGQTQQNNQFNAGQSASQLDRLLSAANGLGSLGQQYGANAAIQQQLIGTDIDRILGIGNQLQDDTQFGLDRAYQEFLRQQEDPINKASAYAGAIGGVPRGQTTTGSQPITRNRTASALGGAAPDAAAGSVFGPWGTAIGGVLGGAYGYFG